MRSDSWEAISMLARKWDSSLSSDPPPPVGGFTVSSGPEDAPVHQCQANGAAALPGSLSLRACAQDQSGYRGNACLPLWDTC